MQIKLTYVNKSESYFAKIKLWIQKKINYLSEEFEAKVYLIEDIERNGYCFTDGIGLISLGLARRAALSIGISVRKDVGEIYLNKI